MILLTLKPENDLQVREMLEMHKVFKMPQKLAAYHNCMWDSYKKAKKSGKTPQEAWSTSLDSCINLQNESDLVTA